MTLRVYFTRTNGETDFTEYGCDSKQYKNVLKVELREDESKVKNWMGSKYVGIPEIDDPKPKRKKKIKKIGDYELFNYKIHDTDTEWFWVSALCTNCLGNTQIAILKNSKVLEKKFTPLRCPKCKLKGRLKRAKWNGYEYMLVERFD